MKAATTVCTSEPAIARSRVADYVDMTKPRISLMVLITVAAGAILGAGGSLSWTVLLHTLFGTALVAAGASALNQLLERETDGLMRRTENRPLPAGRLQPWEVFLVGSALGLVGVIYLLLTVPPMAALVAACTFLSYVFVYTPLKRITSLNTLIGAVPGALPPVIGWAAVRGTIDPEIGALFLIMFLWQVPHFLAIAWIYREDYARAGLCMLPVVDEDGAMTGRQMTAYCFALIAASLMPMAQGKAGMIYLLGAIILGMVFLATAVLFARQRSIGNARSVLRASLIYLPVLLTLLLLDGGAG